MTQSFFDRLRTHNRSVSAAALAFAASCALATAAEAATPAVHELRPQPRAGDGSLRVAGQPPAPHFRRAPGAGASSVRVTDPTAIGTRTNGKIIAAAPGTGSYSCSGTAIETPSRSMILTAGHCVIESGQEAQRMSFVPAYDHGKRPFGTFEVKSVYVMPQWRRTENPAFDLAALRVEPNRFGFLTDVVGARGYATSKSRLSAFQIFGYPAAHAGGEELRSCRAHGLGLDRLTNRLQGPPTMPASCDMAAGASGGGWVFDKEYVGGVTSYGYQGRPTQLFSPYFGPQVGSFLRQLP